MARANPNLRVGASWHFLIESGQKDEGRVFASVARKGMWFAVVVGLAAFLVSRITIPDLDDLLSGALSPVVEMETRRR